MRANNIWQDVLKKFSSTTVAGAMLLIVSSCLVKHTSVPHDVGRGFRQQFNITATISGTIGYLTLELTKHPDGHALSKKAKRNTSNKRSKHMTDNAIAPHTYQLDAANIPVQQPVVYDLYTLAVRLQHLASKRQETLKKINDLLKTSTLISAKAITDVVSACRNLASLEVARRKKFAISGITKGRNLRFAGKRYSNSMLKIEEEIYSGYERLREIKLDTRHLVNCRSKSSFDPEENTYKSKVLSLYQIFFPELIGDGSITSAMNFLEPKITVRGKEKFDTSFVKQALTRLVHLYQARLMLAEIVTHMYEPVVVHYNFVHNDFNKIYTLQITIDDNNKNTYLRYELAVIDSKSFKLGNIDINEQNEISTMHLKLKPLGGKVSMASITFTSTGVVAY